MLLQRVLQPSCFGHWHSISFNGTQNLRPNILRSTQLTRKPLQYRIRSLPNTRTIPPHFLTSVASNCDAATSEGSADSSDAVSQVFKDPDIEGNPEELLRVTEAFWKAMKNTKDGDLRPAGPSVVTTCSSSLEAAPQFDVCIVGGTLGIFVAAALQMRGFRVAVIERRRVEGRTQEWNSSRHELQVLVDCGVLSSEQLERCIVSEYNPVRVGLKGMEDLWVQDVLNVGADPRLLIGYLKDGFVEAGGVLMEESEFKGAVVHPNGVQLKLLPAHGAALHVSDVNRPTALHPSTPVPSYSASSSPARDDVVNGRRNGFNGAHSRVHNGAAAGPREGSSRTSGSSQPSPSSAHQSHDVGSRSGGISRHVTCRLMIDCMGHYSSVVKQIRGRRRPEGMLIVVGSCADGVPPQNNRSADLLYTFSDSADDLQWFWEAFPAADGGRTTYMFAYTDAAPTRPSFRDMLNSYFAALPEYQGVPLSQLKFRRVLMGGFPCYSDGPLRPQWDRMLQIGDAAASQSPLSFGGFGSLLRHLPRVCRGLEQALAEDRLSQSQLALLQPYQPALSASWLYQRSMGLKVGQQQSSSGGVLASDHINRLLRCNFGVMKFWGDRVMRPFLQDTIQLLPLCASMSSMMLRDPMVVTRVVLQVGARVFLHWFVHFAALLLYTVLHAVASPFRSVIRSYTFQRWCDAWQWGSGQDYTYKPPSRKTSTPPAAPVGQEAAEKVPNAPMPETAMGSSV